ncbi:MAG: trehalose-phosphatase [Candidatus Methylomirabilales bacterium]
MRPLLERWEEVEPHLREAQRLLLLTDFDGTLAPMVRDPEKARLPPSRLRLLDTLRQKPGVALGIISGRTLADLKKRVPLEGVYYAGNHGLEIEGPDLKFRHPEAEAARPDLERIREELTLRLWDIPGVFLEDKGFGLSFHLRRVPKTLRPKAEALFDEVIEPFLKAGRVRVNGGKLIWEVRPPVAWDKGDALAVIRDAVKKEGGEPLVIYLGDDSSDEAAFRKLSDEDLPIFVGEPRAPTFRFAQGSASARYFLRNLKEVDESFRRLLRASVPCG